MNLAIDIGNTCVKSALFADNKLHTLKVYDSLEQLIDDSAFIANAQQAIIGSVVDGLEPLCDKLKQKIPTLIFQSITQIPITNLYQSVATLGSDRLAVAVAGYYLHPNKSVLTIDAGTCIKYNFTNNKNEYLGGAISPGIRMRFNALQHFTSKLPLIETDILFTDLIGTNTQNSILSGVLNGSVAEVDGMIDRYKSQYPEVLILLTGGDSEYLAERLKNSIFAHQNLVLKGLNDILNYNLELK